MLSRLNFVIILFIGFVDYLGIGLVYPVFAALLFDTQSPLIPQDAHPSYRGALLGLLIALTPLTQFISSPLLGALSDRKGRKKILAHGMLIGGLGYCLAVLGIWIQSLFLLFIYRMLVGLSEGTVAVAQAMIADISQEENKAKRFSLFNSSLGFGFTVGPFVGGKLAGWYGYMAPFALASGLCLINLILVISRFPETHQEGCKETFSLKSSLLNIQKIFVWDKLRWLFFAVFIFSFGWSFFNEFIPLLLRERFDFNLSDIGNYYAYGGVWYALSAGFASAPLLKYFNPEKVVTKALLGCAFCMLLFLAIPHAAYIWWILPPFMWGLSLTYPTTAALVSNQASKDNQGEILGVYQSVIACAMGLSPLLVGPVIGVFPALIAWGGALAMALASFSLWWGTRLHPQPLLR